MPVKIDDVVNGMKLCMYSCMYVGYVIHMENENDKDDDDEARYQAPT